MNSMTVIVREKKDVLPLKEDDQDKNTTGMHRNKKGLPTTKANIKNSITFIPKYLCLLRKNTRHI